MNVSQKHINVLKAALIELDHNWRKGTSNAGFQDQTMTLLRGPQGPWPHESEPHFLLELLSRPGVKVTISPR